MNETEKRIHDELIVEAKRAASTVPRDGAFITFNALKIQAILEVAAGIEDGSFSGDPS